jgi:lysophospholipase L1-like esterase
VTDPAISYDHMKSLCLRILLSLILLLNTALPGLSAEFFVRDGDRVVFLGDSITEQRLYTTYIEAYALTRHPEWKLWFRNVGWGGDTSWLRQRTHPDEKQLFAATGADLDKMVTDSVGRGLARDVLPLNPTVVTVKFGMNDHSYQAFRPDIFRAYVRSQEEIARVLSSHGARVAFLTPQPIEDKRPDPDKDARNQSLRRFSDGLKEVAAREHATFVDQFDPYMAIMLHARASDPTALIGGGDAVHPGPIGHTIMAWAVLKGLGATPLVSRAEIDLATKKAAGEQCTVENLTVADGTIGFDRVDQALPMPIDRRADAALKLAPVLDDLNRYELQVRGNLSPGNYQVSIDGEVAAKTTAEDLAKGVNLAIEAGPITKQALEILDLVFKKNNTYFTRWRTVQLYEFPKWAQSAEVEERRRSELSRLDQEIAETEAQINQLRKPAKHHFEVKRID